MVDKIKEVLKEQVELIKPSEKEQEVIKKETIEFLEKLKKDIRKKKIKAEVFVGGSVAKDTLIRKNKYDSENKFSDSQTSSKEVYDIDIFVRFDEKYDDKKISVLLGNLVKGKKIHGSRDYFQIKKGKLIFEVVPSIKINRSEQARNVTDLSYFHVRYIKNKIKKNKKLSDEIRLGKSFCYAQDCYGAEGYIQGFSGYALELLISYYGSFVRFINTVKDKKKLILDPNKFYKNKNEILLELNESKLESPIVFVDPTFKERNALAALSKETFNKFKLSCKKFLKHPNKSFFEKKDLEIEFKKRYKDLTILQVKTNRQKGDIGGGKLRKFSKFLIKKLNKDFEIKFNEFEYLEEENIGKIYLILKQKKYVLFEGPPITSRDNLVKFKRKHKKCFIKKGKAYAKEKTQNMKQFLKGLEKTKSLKEMDIKTVEVVS